MPVFYVDTSAALKRYRSETGTDVVDALYFGRKVPGLMDALRGEQADLLVTSLFTCVEVESVAARMRRGRLLTERAQGALLNAFGRDLDEYLHIIPASTDILIGAAGIARTVGLRPGDSVHLSSALYARELSGQDDLVLVSSDKELLAGCPSLQMYTLDPEADNAMEQLRRWRET